MAPHPFFDWLSLLQERITLLTAHARQFFHEVIGIAYSCPHCAGRFQVTGPSQARCESCGVEFDLTLEFQRSPCCEARLKLRQRHYACTACGAVVPSRFLFEEALYDPEYFRKKMSESRERRRRRKEEILLFLAASHSQDLVITDSPNPHALTELSAELDQFIGEEPMVSLAEFVGTYSYRMEDYREIILSRLDGDGIRFAALPAIYEDPRLDSIRRFTTLIFMEHAREVWLEQRGEDIRVMPYETHV